MVQAGLPLVLASVLALTHFLAEELEQKALKHKELVVSFSSGVSISYIFTSLLPEFQRLSREAGNLIFLAPLLGFSSIHLTEKLVAKQGLSPEKAKEEYNEIHSAFLIFYYAAVGFLISSLIAQDTVSGFLFFLPILFHSAVSSFSFSELDEAASELLSVKLSISAAPLLGVLLHRSRFLTDGVFHPLFGVVVGMFIYIVIRDSIPRGDEGRPAEYVLGMAAYLAVILGAQTL